MRISVIVPAINEEKYIGRAIRSLTGQNFKDFEIIVVDGGSTDRTREIVKKHARVIIEKRKGIGLARNVGARIAKGEILLFIDADTVPSKALLSTYDKIFRDKSVIAATGPILPLEKTNRKITVGYKIVSIHFVKASIKVGRPSIVGSNFAVRASAFRKVHGFDEALMTYEDWDLSNRIKKLGRIVYSDKALVYTSIRRILVWGVVGYFAYHSLNFLRYHLLRKPMVNYRQIR